MKDLEDKEIRNRNKDSLRKSVREALVQVSLEVITLRAATDNNERVDEMSIVDIIPFIKKIPSVAESAEDLAAVQTILTDINKGQAERIGLSILRACLGT